MGGIDNWIELKSIISLEKFNPMGKSLCVESNWY
jgi:hypothetical protein